jgi:hypothetical protein
MLGIVIGLAWVLPMLIFWYQAWDTRNPMITMAYLACSGLSLAVALLPESYFQPKPAEFNVRLYEALGIRRFRRYMIHGDYMNSLIRRSEPGYRIVKGRGSIRNFEAGTRASERGHLILLASGMPATIYALASGWTRFGAYFILANIVLNVYPILLQRYTRVRIQRALLLAMAKPSF